MWTRKDLKDRAKLTLKQNYWKAFVASLFFMVLSSGFSGGSLLSPIMSMMGSNGSTSNPETVKNLDQLKEWFNDPSKIDPKVLGAVIGVIVAIAVMVFIIVLIVSLVYTIFVANPINVNISKIFIEERGKEADLNHLLFSFKKGRYASIVRAMAWKTLFTFLWTMLFIIPGIVKSYSYSMVPYLMADNPGLDYKSALKLSMHMTDGQKGKIFVLDLSFIGWAFLGVLAFGIGIVFLAPYINATKAELYSTLKDKAVQEGLIVPNTPQPVAVAE